jgi:hypothetical protein
MILVGLVIQRTSSITSSQHPTPPLRLRREVGASKLYSLPNKSGEPTVISRCNSFAPCACHFALFKQVSAALLFYTLFYLFQASIRCSLSATSLRPLSLCRRVRLGSRLPERAAFCPVDDWLHTPGYLFQTAC